MVRCSGCGAANPEERTVCYVCTRWISATPGLAPAASRNAPRFGSLAVTLGYLSAAEVERALAIQEREDRAGAPHRRLGHVCADQGYLSAEELQAVLKWQVGRVCG